jgi:putative MATE family efflux protein
MGSQELRQSILSGPLLASIGRQLPANVVALGFQGFVGAMDVFFISHLGTEAIAAVTLVFPCLALMRTIAATALGTATSSLVAVAIGKGNIDAARSSAINGSLLSLAFGALWTALFVVFGEGFFSRLGATGDQLRIANTYSLVIFWGAPLTCIAQICLGVLRGIGSAGSATLIATIGGIVQLAVTPLLMFGGYGPLLSGVSGAALGFLAASLSMVLISPYMINRSVPGLLDWKAAHLTLDAKILVRFISTAGPATINSVMNYSVLLVLSAIVATLGSESLAAFGIVSRIEYFGLLVIFGAGATTVTFVAMNFGADHVLRARQAIWLIAVITIGGLCVVGLPIMMKPDILTMVFSADASVRQATGAYLRSGLVGLPLLGLGLIIYYASLAVSRPMLPSLINAIRCTLLAATVWLAIKFLNAGLFGVGLCVTLTSFAYAVFMLAWMERSSLFRPARSTGK